MFNAIRVGDEALMIKRRNKILIGITAYVVSHVQCMQCNKRIRFLLLRMRCAQLFNTYKGHLLIKNIKSVLDRSFTANTLNNL